MIESQEAQLCAILRDGNLNPEWCMPDSDFAPPPAARGSARLSVVMPTHNRPEFLVEAIESVIAQRFQHWELIVVDDGSIPPVRLTPIHARDHRIRLMRNNEPIGGAASKSSGASFSAAEIVTFLDDDDRFEEGKVEAVVRLMDSYPELDTLFVGVGWFGKDANEYATLHDGSLASVLHKSQPKSPEQGLHIFDERLFLALLYGVPMSFQRVVARRASLKRVGPYRSDCCLWDCDWALRAALTTRCGLIASPLYLQRAEGQGYFSVPTRVLSHHKAGLEMVERLYADPPVPLNAATRSALRKAIATSARDFAYLLGRHGLLRESWSAWARSQQMLIDPTTWKMPIGALLRAIRARK